MKDTIFYKIVRPILKGLFYILYLPKIEGIKNIPDSGRVVFAGNHTNNLDCILLISSTKRQIHFLAKDSLYKGIFGSLFKAMGIIPVDRSIHDKSALNNGINALNNDLVVGIFPEGTINKTKDTVMPFKIGAVKMAHDTNSSIIPFIITGKYKLFKRPKIKFLNAYRPSEDLTKSNEELMEIIIKELENNK